MSIKKFAASILTAEASSATGGKELFTPGEYEVYFEGATATDDQAYIFLEFSLVDDPAAPHKFNMYGSTGVAGKISASDVKACLCALFDVNNDEFLPFLLEQGVDPTEVMCAAMGVSENTKPKEKKAVEFVAGYTGAAAGCPIHLSVRQGKENAKKPGEYFTIVKYSASKS